jgi:TRAP-type C4-dicarboxylate transport system permease small subunit
MKHLRALDRLLDRLEFVLLAVFLGAMVLLAFLQVVLRNLFGGGLVWADTVVRHLVLWSGFVGAALATSEGRHINIDAVTKLLPSTARRLIHCATSAFAATVCWYLAQAAWVYVREERLTGGELVLSIPTWVALLIIPAGYLLIAFHFLIRALEHLVVTISRRAKAR